MKREAKELKLAIVVPCFNEEECLDRAAKTLSEELIKMKRVRGISKDSFLLFVDDGSKDKTWKKIERLAQSGKIVGVKLAKNVGHQNALLAGLEYAKGVADIVVSIDADLQDDVAAIPRMVKKYQEGAEIVFGVREERSQDRWFKKTSAKAFYSLMRRLGVDLVSDSADFRLMSRRAIEELLKYKEANIFLRGIVPRLGFSTDVVKYERKARVAGESKYTLKKMMNFASDGITSFSNKPIRMILLFGLVVSLIAFLAMIVLVVIRICGEGVSGRMLIFGTVWLLGGLQLTAIGIVGEYIGKINIETKARPRFVVERVIREQKSQRSRK
jgi:glycosyltransferase involved in cell wall biosynthesis